MGWLRLFLSAFGIVFISEMGDKTQLTTMLLAGQKPLWVVYVALGSAMALITTSFVEILIGSTFVARFLSPARINLLSGIAFTVMGVLLLTKII
ncbi:MAG TPA: TMEM165/GDT1 family protein [Bacillota bacterium]|nr:TMEM165/GDT1 family protein [Bacillota bacterium]